jgi:hypothetical protein
MANATLKNAGISVASARPEWRRFRFSGHETAGLKAAVRAPTLLGSAVRVRGFQGERSRAGRLWTMGFEPECSRWPPLRLARVSRELVSVVVVSPLLLREFNNR